MYSVGFISLGVRFRLIFCLLYVVSKARALHLGFKECFFKTQPDNDCKTHPWELTAHGSFKKKGTRPVILSGAGLPTENTWKLIDNTGLELEDIEEKHTQGSRCHRQHACSVIGLAIHSCKSCWAKVTTNWQRDYSAFQQKYAMLRLDSANLVNKRTRYKLSSSNVFTFF